MLNVAILGVQVNCLKQPVVHVCDGPADTLIADMHN